MSLPEQLESLAREAQTETQALREIIRQKDVIITELKSHCLCLRMNYKKALEGVQLACDDVLVKKHCQNIIEALNKDPEQRLGGP